jgi:hypothetical protein
LGETAVDVGNIAAQQCLNLHNMRAQRTVAPYRTLGVICRDGNPCP